jgi:hypothetical protein
VQIIVTPEIGIAWIIAGAIAFVTFLVYYKFIYRKTKDALERFQSAHFLTAEFIKDMRMHTFEFYNKKWDRVLGVGVALIISGIIVPVFLGIPTPYNAIVMGVWVLSAVFVIVLWLKELEQREKDRNINTTYITAHAMFPDEGGETGLLIKRAEVEKEITLSEKQCEATVDEFMIGIKKLPEWGTSKVDEQKVKALWLERFKKVRAIRVKAGKYLLLIITQNSFQSMKTPDAKEMIDETVDVKVQLAPMFLVFVGPATRVFRSVNDDGKPIFTDRKMGIFVDLFNLAKRNEVLLGGDYTAPSYLDSLFGKYLHIVEQNTATAVSMTDTETTLDKANLDIEEKEFGADVEKIMDASERLDKTFGEMSTEPPAKKDYLLWLLLFGFGLALGSVIPYLISLARGG